MEGNGSSGAEEWFGVCGGYMIWRGGGFGRGRRGDRGRGYWGRGCWKC